jgi:hypothetical protein
MLIFICAVCPGNEVIRGFPAGSTLKRARKGLAYLLYSFLSVKVLYFESISLPANLDSVAAFISVSYWKIVTRIFRDVRIVRRH